MITFTEIEGRPDLPTLEKIETIYKAVFEVFKAEEFALRMSSAEKILIILAFSGDEIAGFKVGYELDAEKFYSWIGGVRKEFRKQGIADELMKRQHEWCKKQGYRIVQTKTKNTFKPMLILNIKNGFDIVELQRGSQNEIKIVLEKKLEI